MKKYDFLLAAKECGLLKLLALQFQFPTHFADWMDIYAFHVEHPKCSNWQIAMHFDISKHKVNDALRFMNEDVTAEIHFSFPN